MPIGAASNGLHADELNPRAQFERVREVERRRARALLLNTPHAASSRRISGRNARLSGGNERFPGGCRSFRLAAVSDSLVGVTDSLVAMGVAVAGVNGSVVGVTVSLVAMSGVRMPGHARRCDGCASRSVWSQVPLHPVNGAMAGMCGSPVAVNGLVVGLNVSLVAVSGAPAGVSGSPGAVSVSLVPVVVAAVAIGVALRGVAVV